MVEGYGANLVEIAFLIVQPNYIPRYCFFRSMHELPPIDVDPERFFFLKNAYGHMVVSQTILVYESRLRNWPH